jgi:hypothetical protein
MPDWGAFRPTGAYFGLAALPLLLYIMIINV